MARLDIYSSQSLFRSGYVLLICVGGSVCHGEGYPNHFGYFLACIVSQHRRVRVSRLISALVLAIYLISPQPARNTAHNSLLVQLSFIWPSLCLLSPIDCPRAPSQPKRIHPSTLKRENNESDGC